nr:peptide-methionine (S)-S-oxide reductase [Saprospiraceae bacterium]
MKALFLFFIIFVGIFSCAQTKSKTMDTNSIGKVQVDLKDKAVATFAGGCFWCTETIFESIKGV